MSLFRTSHQLTLPKLCNRLLDGNRIRLSIPTNVTKSFPFKLGLLKANSLTALSFKEIWEVFFHTAVKFKHEFKKIPVLIIDNANRLAENQLKLLEQIQD